MTKHRHPLFLVLTIEEVHKKLPQYSIGTLRRYRTNPWGKIPAHFRKTAALAFGTKEENLFQREPTKRFLPDIEVPL